MMTNTTRTFTNKPFRKKVPERQKFELTPQDPLELCKHIVENKLHDEYIIQCLKELLKNKRKPNVGAKEFLLMDFLRIPGTYSKLLLQEGLSKDLHKSLKAVTSRAYRTRIKYICCYHFIMTSPVKSPLVEKQFENITDYLLDNKITLDYEKFKHLEGENIVGPANTIKKIKNGLSIVEQMAKDLLAPLININPYLTCHIFPRNMPFLALEKEINRIAPPGMRGRVCDMYYILRLLIVGVPYFTNNVRFAASDIDAVRATEKRIDPKDPAFVYLNMDKQMVSHFEELRLLSFFLFAKNPSSVNLEDLLKSELEVITINVPYDELINAEEISGKTYSALINAYTRFISYLWVVTVKTYVTDMNKINPPSVVTNQPDISSESPSIEIKQPSISTDSKSLPSPVEKNL